MEHLIGLGIPQRTAHETIGQLVATAMEQDVALAELPLETFQAAHAALDHRVYDVLGSRQAIEALHSYGSTAPDQVAKQVARWRQRLMPDGLTEQGPNSTGAERSGIQTESGPNAARGEMPC
jgi:argininosuccinate lyase